MIRMATYAYLIHQLRSRAYGHKFSGAYKCYADMWRLAGKQLWSPYAFCLVLIVQLFVIKVKEWPIKFEGSCSNLIYELKLPAPSLSSQAKIFKDSEKCQKNSNPDVAIIIPYRNRSENLQDLLYHLRLFLAKQGTKYRIFIIEQTGQDLLNKASLMNAGAKEILRDHPKIECLIFHDVDLIPEVEELRYECSNNFSKVRHLSVAISNLNYTLPYESLVGGVVAFTRQQFEYLNGYSNAYWGWGGEDDDLAERLKHHGFHVERPLAQIGRYRALFHSPSAIDAANKRWHVLDKAHWRYYTDGLHNVLYKLMDKKNCRGFLVNLKVKLLPPVGQ